MVFMFIMTVHHDCDEDEDDVHASSSHQLLEVGVICAKVCLFFRFCMIHFLEFIAKAAITHSILQ